MLASQQFPTPSSISHHHFSSPACPRPESIVVYSGSSTSSSPTHSLPHFRAHTRSFSQSHTYSISSTASTPYYYHPQQQQQQQPYHHYYPASQQPLNYAPAAPRSAAHIRSISISSSTSSTRSRPSRPRPPPVAGQSPIHTSPNRPQQQYELYIASMQSQYQMAAAQQQQLYAQPIYPSQQHNQHTMPPPQQYAGYQYGGQQQHMSHQYAQQQQYGYSTQLQGSHLSTSQQHNCRSPSVATFSITSSVPPAAYHTSSGPNVRRSTSSRSGGSIPPSSQGSGYVALLRRQKATVWSASTQNEDPNIVAQRRHDKMRATRQIAGGRVRMPSGNGSGRTSTGISATGKVAAKIRHHGKQTVTGFHSDNHVGVGGVPIRLSATEVEGESSDEEEDSLRLNHRRTSSSGRNSIASARRITYRPSGTFNQRRWSPSNTPERTGSLMEEPNASSLTINAAPAVEKITAAMAAVKIFNGSETASLKAMSTHSGSSERADNVGELDEMPKLAAKSQAHANFKREKGAAGSDELKRRGSVDERTMTLTSGRLYIANPDLD